MVVTAEERRLALEGTADDFCTHLKTAPGAVLSPNLRLGVAACARDALVCKACDALPPDTCLAKGTDFMSICKGHKVDVFKPTTLKDKDVLILVNLVHAIIRHQGRLDEAWYNKTINFIQSSGLLASYPHKDEEGKLLGCRAIFSEVLALSAAYQAIQMVFFGLGKNSPPPLPSRKDMAGAPGPANIHFPSLLHRVRFSKAVRDTPFYIWHDINTESPEFSKITPEGRDMQHYIQEDLSPFCGTCFAPEDSAFIGRNISDVMYCKGVDVLFAYQPLDYKIHCSSVQRCQLEFVSLAVAETHSCAFWQTMHATFRAVSVHASDPARNTHETALTNFGKAIATLPFDLMGIISASKGVEFAGGDELLVEAAGTAGTFECMTRLTDASLARAPPATMMSAMRIGLICMYRWKSIVPTIAAIIAVLYMVLRG